MGWPLREKKGHAHDAEKCKRLSHSPLQFHFGQGLEFKALARRLKSTNPKRLWGVSLGAVNLRFRNRRDRMHRWNRTIQTSNCFALDRKSTRLNSSHVAI